MKARGISAEVITMLSGQFSLLNSAVIEEQEITYLNGSKEFEVIADEGFSALTTSKHTSTFATYSTFTGRFGLTSEHHDKMDMPRTDQPSSWPRVSPGPKPAPARDLKSGRRPPP